MKIGGPGRHRKYATPEEAKAARNAYKPLQNQPDKIKEIVAVLLQQPDLTYAQIAPLVGLEKSTIQDYMKSNKYLIALRQLANIKATHLIPKALRALEDSLDSISADVKFRSATKLLESEGIIGPTKVDISITDGRTPEELHRIIQEAKEIPAPTIPEDRFKMIA